SGAAFAFQERDMLMCFCIFHSGAQIKNMRIKHKALLRNFKRINGIMFFSIQDMLFISCQDVAEMYIITVTAEAVAVVRNNFDGTFFYFFKNAFVGEN